MESNFVYNYLENLHNLQEILLQPHIDRCKAEMQFMEMETADGGLDKYYFIDDDQQPCCKFSFKDNSIMFYEKDNKGKSKVNSSIPPAV